MGKGILLWLLGSPSRSFCLSRCSGIVGKPNGGRSVGSARPAPVLLWLFGIPIPIFILQFAFHVV